MVAVTLLSALYATRNLVAEVSIPRNRALTEHGVDVLVSGWR